MCLCWQIALGEGIMAAESTLTELDLSDNAFGPTGVQPIIPLLTSSSFYSIKVLKFNNNGLGITGGKVSRKILCKFFVCNRDFFFRFCLKHFSSVMRKPKEQGRSLL